MGGQRREFAVVVVVLLLLLNDGSGTSTDTGCWRKKAADDPAWVAGEEVRKGVRKGVEVCVREGEDGGGGVVVGMIRDAAELGYMVHWNGLLVLVSDV